MGGLEPLRIRGGVTVGIVLYMVERPQEAVVYIDRALERCERYAGRQPTSDRLALLAMCRLAKAEVARAIGDPRAEEIAQRARDALPRVSGPAEKAAALYAIGTARVDRGEGAGALEILQEADTLLGRASPKGTPAQAVLALTLAAAHQQRGETEAALVQVERSRVLWERMFPETHFKNGHPGLILALISLGDVLQQLGRKDRALLLHRRALDLSRAYYSGDHENKLLALLSYGHSLRVSRTPGQAPAAYLEKFQEAVAMGERLYGPTGHPNLAVSRILLGTALAERGQSGPAFKQFEAAGAYYRRRYPKGHPHVAVLAQVQGVLNRQLGDRAGAAKCFREALELDQDLLVRLSTRNVADAEAFALGRQRQLSYHGYLSASRDLPAAEQVRAYLGVWQAKGAVTRLLAERRAIRRLGLGPMATGRDGCDSTASEAARLSRMWEELGDTEARLGRLLFDEHEEPAVRAEAVSARAARDAELRRELTRRVPEFRRQDALRRLGPDALARLLPPGSAFVDIIRYEDFLAGTGAAPRYAAFVLVPGREPLRAELGPAAPIDEAVGKWRDAVVLWDPFRTIEQRGSLEAASDGEGSKLRRLVWEPIAVHLPAGTTRLFLSPDGALAGLPFAALPGPEARTALVDQYVIACVPHGPFLLESLSREAPPVRGQGPFLALGAVEYDLRHAALEGSAGALQLARRVATTRPTITLQQREATPKALRQALPQAGDALIETHAFYRKKLRTDEQERRLAFVRDWPPAGGLAAPRDLAPTARSPLIYTGLILAREGRAPGEGVELSGGLIAELSLGGLRSAFLPDCDTGVGEYLPAEGVQSLQEAFHLAGCPNVIASLWPVADAPTEALVAGYYDRLWDEGHRLSTPEALCLAQRDLYHNPSKAGVQADAHGHFPEQSHPKLWAGLVHSGIGR